VSVSVDCRIAKQCRTALYILFMVEAAFVPLMSTVESPKECRSAPHVINHEIDTFGGSIRDDAIHDDNDSSTASCSSRASRGKSIWEGSA
jgi:hypothetical protein